MSAQLKPRLRIQELLSSRGWKQSHLSKLTGIKQPRISGFVTGKNLPSVANLVKLADAFRCTLDQLLDREPVHAMALSRFSTPELLDELQRRLGEKR